eukprot:5049615-Pyramimonas_sp.AAC.1
MGTPDYVDWGRKVKTPCEVLVLSSGWADRNFTWMKDGQFVRVLGPKVSSDKVVPSSSSSSGLNKKPPNPPLPRPCARCWKDFSGVGSSA